MTDVLYRSGTGVIANFLHPRGTLVTIGTIHANLDQRVRCEVPFDFRQHGWRQAIARDADHRLQVMRLSAQRAAKGGRQFSHFMFHSSKGAILLT